MTPRLPDTVVETRSEDLWPRFLAMNMIAGLSMCHLCGGDTDHLYEVDHWVIRCEKCGHER